MKKKGTILVENIIFIILNLLFLAVLVLFLVKQGSGAIVLEQAYAKQISMLVDSAKPVMEIKIDMEKGRKIAKENGMDFDKAVFISGNFVRVKLSERGGYTYSFFNDVDVNAHAIKDAKGDYTGMYLLRITSGRRE